MMFSKLSIRYLRTLGIGSIAIGVVVASIYFFMTFGALSSPMQSTAYRDISWDDLLEQRPPPNQMVFVQYTPGIDASLINEPIRVEGTLHTEMQNKSLAQAAYSMHADRAYQYKGT